MCGDLMVLMGWSKIPVEARRLIVYYTLSSIPYAVYVFFPIYMYILGFDIELVGYLLTTYYLLVAISKYIVGRLLDIKLSPKTCIILIDSLGAVENLIYSVASTPYHFLLAFVLASIASPLFIAYRTIEKDLYPSDMLEVTYRHHMFWPYIAQVFSLVTMGLYLWLSNDLLYAFRILFVLTAMGSFLVVLYTVFYIPDTSTIVSTRHESRRKLGKIFDRALVYFATAEILIVSAFAFTPSFVLQNYLYNILGFTIISITIIETFDTTFRGLGSIFHEKFERHGRLLLLIASLVMASLAGIFIYITNVLTDLTIIFIIIILSIIFMGLGESIWWIQHEAFILPQIPEEHRGEVFGLISSIRSLIDIATPTVAALLASKISPLAPYVVYSFLLLGAIPLYLVGVREVRETS